MGKFSRRMVGFLTEVGLRKIFLSPTSIKIRRMGKFSVADVTVLAVFPKINAITFTITHLYHVFNDPHCQQGEHPVGVYDCFHPLFWGSFFCIHLHFDCSFLFQLKTQIICPQFLFDWFLFFLY